VVGVWGLALGVQGSRSRVQGLGFREVDSGFRVYRFRFIVEYVAFGVWSLGFRL